MEIDRRGILVGSGLAALALSGCGQDGETKGGRNAGASADAASKMNFASFDRAWNLGDAPWDRLDEAINAPSATVAFTPRYVTVLHLELKLTPKLLLAGRRAHFEVADMANNTQTAIQTRVREVINYMNSTVPATRPSFLNPGNDKQGLKGFGFRKGQHHFIIYINHTGIQYNRDAPIWFGLYRAGLPFREASPNRTFYDAQVYLDSQIVSAAKEFIYVKNYFRTADEHPLDFMKPSNRRGIVNENLIYSLNINALIQTTDNPALTIPIIFDPDTGNMGTGGGGIDGAGPD